MLKVNRGIIKKLNVSNPFELFSKVDYAREGCLMPGMERATGMDEAVDEQSLNE